jgi:hypothetical protein
MQFPSFQSAVKHHWRKINMRVASAVLVFLLSWLAAPTAMWAQPLDYCSMECCVAEGQCCCASQKLWVEGQDYSGVGEIGQTAVESSCPCPATPLTSAKVFSRQIPRTIWHEPAADQSPQLICHSQDSGYSSLRFTPKSPHSPPVFLLSA